MASRPRSPEIDDLRASIRKTGLRATPSRIAVLGLLRRQPTPLSHGEVVAAMEDQGWDRATIYRNLIDLTEVGLARRTDVGDHVWRFEATTGDDDQDEHPHFVCTECGIIECLPELELRVPQRKRTPRAIRDRQVEVQLRGLCDDCT
jgi:Fur family transcriptional regulator, ferric uptake regulator